MKKDFISENLLANLGLNLLFPKLKRDLTTAISKLDQDPDLAATLESLKYWSTKAENDLKVVCKDNPNSPLCKEKGKK